MSLVSAHDLLRLCEAARDAGHDFPTIWNTILRTHPLVRGLPRHEIDGGDALIVVRLVTGCSLISSTQGFHLR